jgi:hypothetical protein
MINEEKFKQDFMESWDQYMEPLFLNKKLIFECSPQLKEHLLKVGRFEYTDNEIWDLVESGKI